MENKEANEKLMTAVIMGDIEAAIEAIQSGASVHQKTVKGNNLLYVAASRGQDEMFDWLLEVEQGGKKIDLDSQNNMGATTLLDFVREDGFTNYVEKILKAGANPNLTTNDGMSPLIQACADKKVKEAELLVAHNADVNYTINDTKTTAFLMAASQSSMPICQLLKENNADVNALDSTGKNALLTAIFKTTKFMRKREKAEHQELCKFLAEIGIDVNYVAPSGMTALWAASINNFKELTEFLLEKGANADVTHEIGLDGKMSAIHIWVNSKEVELVKKLHAAGAKLGVPDELGNVAEAYGFMNPNMRELMMDLGGDVNAIYSSKKSSPNEVPKRIPVISAIINGGNNQHELVKKMIDAGAKVTFEDESLHAYEPIMSAIAASAVDIIRDLVATKQIDLNKPVKINPHAAAMTPLMMAVSGAVNQSFSAFLEKKAQYELLQAAKEENDKNGIKSELIDDETMAQIEADLQKMKSIEAQLKAQRKDIYDILRANNVDLDATNEDGRSAIFFCNGKDYADWIKNDGADLYLEDNDGNNPLIYAVLNNKKELMHFLKSEYSLANHPTINDIFYQLAFLTGESHMQQSLLEKGIRNYVEDEIDMEKFKEPDSVFNVKSINYKDEDGNSPVLVACANDAPFLVSLYMKLGADINLANNNGETPLMHAISTGNSRMVEFLVEKGADLNAKTNDGKSILDFAVEINDKQILEKIKIGLGHEVTEGSISGVKKIRAI